jgi:excisionase family DNA binding protein
MARPRNPKTEDAPTVSSASSTDAGVRSGGPADPRAFGFVKAAYSVREALELLSIGRTSLYAAVRRGELRRVKFGKRTLFCATDLAAFLTHLQARDR